MPRNSKFRVTGAVIFRHAKNLFDSHLLSWQRIYLYCPVILLVGLLGLMGAGQVFAQGAEIPKQAGIRDFVEYWAAARLLANGGNPYSPDELLTIQRSVGWGGAAPLVMWNPPWSFVFTLPFGLFDFTVSQFFWLLFHVCLILISARQLWRLYGGSAQGSRLSWVLALTFVPAVFVLIIGQITPLVLAGLTAFLHSERKRNSMVMGAALVILSIKPHVLYLFWIFFFLWILDQGSWRLVLGALLPGVVAVLLPLLFNSNVYSEYFTLYGIADVRKPLEWPAPTLRNSLAILLGFDNRWLELTPTVIAVIWALYYWRRHKDAWSWLDQLPLISVVSVVSSIFIWTYDQVVLLPAILEGAVWVRQRPRSWLRSWTARVYIMINVAHLLLRFSLAEELWYSWLAPAFLANYLLFCWERRKNS